MRLIDADKVIQSIDRQMIIARELLGNDPQAQEFVSIAEQSIKQEISNAPTVKAIPMGWISEYSRKPLSNADYWAIMRMVTEWEKENEID